MHSVAKGAGLKFGDASNAAAGWQEGEAFPKTSLFDVCSMQFALHYMFQNEERLDNFHSWCPQLKRGGYFISTTMDSDVVWKHCLSQLARRTMSSKRTLMALLNVKLFAAAEDDDGFSAFGAGDDDGGFSALVMRSGRCQ